ncbi:MAG: hypothetical protein OHK003_22300 [Anaerolineales bacterium]
MDNFRKTIAVFCAISFIFTSVMATLLFNFDRRAFTAETYQRAFAREDFYNKLPRLMAQSIASSSADQSQFPLVMHGMSLEAWESFMHTLLPPEVLKPIGDNMLNSTFNYLSMKTNVVQVNLTPLKASMMSETGTQAALALIGTLPACTLEQITQITFNLFAGGQIELCNPPADMLPLLAPIIQEQMQFTASIIPDQLTLVTAPLQNDPRERLQTTRLFMRLSLLLPIGFLLAVTIAAIRSVKDWLNWWGIPILITGFAIFMIGILGAPVFGVVLEGILARSLPNYLPAFLLDFTGNFASAMVRALLNPLLWQGLILAFIGGGMTGIGYFTRE